MPTQNLDDTTLLIEASKVWMNPSRFVEVLERDIQNDRPLNDEAKELIAAAFSDPEFTPQLLNQVIYLCSQATNFQWGVSDLDQIAHDGFANHPEVMKPENGYLYLAVRAQSELRWRERTNPAASDALAMPPRPFDPEQN